MENNKERVLAYNMAKQISREELEAVSGGKWIWSCRWSAGGSAGSGQPTEGHFDGHWDF